MAKVTVSKKDGKRYLTIETSEYTGALKAAVDRVFELKAELREAEATAIAAHDAEHTTLMQHPIRFQWGKVSVGLDAKREAQAVTTSSPKLNLAQFLVAQAASGRAA
jgi:hypothetical protein